MGKINIADVDTLLNRSELRPTARSGGIPLFDFSDSERLLKLCERLRIGVLGIEGFTLSNGDLRPDMDYIGDFSSLLGRSDFEEESVRSAWKFLQLAAGVPQLLFEYVLVNGNASLTG